MSVLTINIGSSSVRVGLHGSSVLHGDVQQKFGIELEDTALRARLGTFLEAHGVNRPIAVCHRIVHAGPLYTKSCIIGENVVRAICSYTPLAPLHNPATLRMISICRDFFGSHTPQMAVFDTGFFSSLPDIAACYAIPPSLGIRRMGFHGIAHQSMVRMASAIDSRYARITSLQLGSGCSIAASRDGNPIDTSMGFTPLEGLMMNTRCGDIDPGAILHLHRELGMDAASTEKLLNHKSGLLGVSGKPANLAELLTLDDSRSKLAVEMFCYRIRKYLGAYAAILGGLDVITIGGGIGEHLSEIRRKFLSGLEFLGIFVDPNRNQAASGTGGVISSDNSPVRVEVMKVNENKFMAKETYKLLSRDGAEI